MIFPAINVHLFYYYFFSIAMLVITRWYFEGIFTASFGGTICWDFTQKSWDFNNLNIVIFQVAGATRINGLGLAAGKTQLFFESRFIAGTLFELNGRHASIALFEVETLIPTVYTAVACTILYIFPSGAAIKQVWKSRQSVYFAKRGSFRDLVSALPHNGRFLKMGDPKPGWGFKTIFMFETVCFFG
jgi:hypothetical protein